MLKNALTFSLLGLTLALAACSDKSEPVARSAPLPPGLFLATEPAGARDVKDIKPGAKVGEAVTLIGRIGGSTEPFVEGRALFTMVDQRVKACGEGTAMDSCETPWDYCCEPRDQLTLNMATVRIVGPDGQPLKTGLKDVQGLNHLVKVAVVGTVAEATGENLVVNASGLYVLR